MTTPAGVPSATDYEASSDEQVSTSVAKWNANLDAIQLRKKLQAEGRQASPAEQEILAKHSGFGDIAFEQGFSY